jgi:GNAT superfamily N-acetyltransferase
MQYSPHPPMTLIAPSAGLFDAWFSAFTAYAHERSLTIDRQHAGNVWRWLLDGTYRLGGMLALDASKNVIGFVHYHPSPRTLAGDEVCILDDLYITPAHRASGVERALIDHLCSIAGKRGWNEIRWTTSSALANLERDERIIAHPDLATFVLRG